MAVSDARAGDVSTISLTEAVTSRRQHRLQGVKPLLHLHLLPSAIRPQLLSSVLHSARIEFSIEGESD